MEWNVYTYDFNKNEIERYNIFWHGSFVEYVKNHIKKYKNKDEFADRLKSELQYYFWSKCEWELIIEVTEDSRIFLVPWVGCRNTEGAKIDVTDDTDFDWRSFAEYHINRQVHKDCAKIDVYDQVMMNWDSFLDYVWSNKKELK